MIQKQAFAREVYHSHSPAQRSQTKRFRWIQCGTKGCCAAYRCALLKEGPRLGSKSGCKKGWVSAHRGLLTGDMQPLPVPLTLPALLATACPAGLGTRLQEGLQSPPPGLVFTRRQRGFETGPGTCSTASHHVSETVLPLSVLSDVCDS